MSALDESVTLEDVLAVVTARRVPLAAELAGYLTLEMAEGADPYGGDIDPRTVFVGEEGTVALVRPRKETTNGDAEASIRRLLGQLLDASGSQTPSLVATARRRSGGGLGPLAQELEGALVPVNRAAGRRALARLAREVKRVTMGLGRNASGPLSERRGATPPPPSVGSLTGTPPPVGYNTANPPHVGPPSGYNTAPVSAPAPLPTGYNVAPNAAGTSPSGYDTAPPPAGYIAHSPNIPKASAPFAFGVPGSGAIPPGVPGSVAASRDAFASEDFDHRTARRDVPAELLDDGPARPVAPVSRNIDITAPTRRFVKPSAGDDVDSLLASFDVPDHGSTDRDASRRLKEMVGLDPTPDPRAPLPPGARPPLPTPYQDASTDTDIETLLAMSDPGPPVSPVRPLPKGTATQSEVFVGPHRDADPSSEFTPQMRKVAATSLGMGPGGRSPTGPVPTAGSSGAVRVGGTTGSVPRVGAGTGPVPRVGGTTGPVPRVGGATGPVRVGGATGPVPRVGGTTGPVPQGAGSTGSLAMGGAAQTGAWAAQDPSIRRTGGAPPRRRAIDALLFGAILAVLGGGGAVLFLLKPGFLSGRTPEKLEAEKSAAEADRARLNLEQSAAACKATLIVADAPPHSEVLLRVGVAPADVDRMPVGTRLEFVAVLEGHRAKRAVVPAGASWDRGEGGRPRFEVAVQLDPFPRRGNGADVWPPAEPGSEVGGKGPPGTVHVVSTPRGAEIWLLAGVGPEAVIEQLRCNEPVEVLVAGPTTYRRRLRLGADDFKPSAENAGARSARVSVKGDR